MDKDYDALRRAIRGAGSLTKLAKGLGIRTQSISGWRRVPAARVLDVERISGVPRHELREDLYPRETGPRTDAAA